MNIKKQLIKRQIGQDVILVPVGTTVLENNGLFLLNESGGYLWDLLSHTDSPEELVRRMMEEYEVTEEEASADVESFLNNLKKLEIL